MNHAVLHWLNRVIGKKRYYIGILLFLQSILGISSVFYAMGLREIVNEAVSGDRNGFFFAVFCFGGLVVFQIIFRALNRFFVEYTRSAMENCLKKRLFEVLLTGDYASVMRIHTGEWMNRLTSDTVVVADGLTQILPGAAGMAVKMAGAFAAILILEPRFLYILIPGGVLLIILTYSFRKIMKRLHKQIQEADGRMRIFLQERLGSMLIVRSFMQETQTGQCAEHFMEEHRAARMKRSNFSNICNIGFAVLMNGAYVLGAIFCGYGILTETMSYGNLMAVLQLISQIQNPIANISGYLPRYYAMLASAERLMEPEKQKIEYPIAIVSGEAVQTFYKDFFLEIGLKNAAFTYQPPVQDVKEVHMPVVLTDVNLKIRKGEYVAFTGPSGCGKSTVLKLLMGLYPLDSGVCYLLTKSGEQKLDFGYRGLFAYVPQGNQLINGSIREIIAFGDPEKIKQDESIYQALKIACADTFVSELEQAIDTVLGERGMGLSEGQMQRLAIARAVFSNHPILLLDEATSALDEITEKKVLENLRDMTDKTVIIVTHRSAVLSICDNVIGFL